MSPFSHMLGSSVTCCHNIKDYPAISSQLIKDVLMCNSIHNKKDHRECIQQKKTVVDRPIKPEKNKPFSPEREILAWFDYQKKKKQKRWT